MKLFRPSREGSRSRLFTTLATILAMGGGAVAPSYVPGTQAVPRGTPGTNVRAVAQSQAKQERTTPAPVRNVAGPLLGLIRGLGGGDMPIRGGGHTPYDWGTSRACAQMRRKNRMRSLGIRGSRI